MAGIAKPFYPAENHLLSALPDKDYRHLLQYLQPMNFSLGEIISEPGGLLDYVYFPISSVVSLLYTTQEGSTAETGLIGNDGIIGMALLLGGDTTTNRAVV